VEGPVYKGTPRPAVMIIREFMWMVSSPHKECNVSGVRQLPVNTMLAILHTNYNSDKCVLLNCPHNNIKLKQNSFQSSFKTVTRLCKYVCLIRNRGRPSEWRGSDFNQKLLNSRFCACAWKYAKSSLTVLSNRHSVWQIVVAEHDDEGSFQSGSRNNTIFLRMRTKETAKT